MAIHLANRAGEHFAVSLAGANGTRYAVADALVWAGLVGKDLAISDDAHRLLMPNTMRWMRHSARALGIHLSANALAFGAW